MSSASRVIFRSNNPIKYSSFPSLIRFARLSKAYYSWLYLLTVCTLFQNGRQFSIILFTCKLALVASFKGKYSFEFRV